MSSTLPQHRSHSRTWHSNKFVYPVLSRRSKGISIGVNLNPDKICNFDCIYCQVNRRSESEVRFVESQQLLQELGDTLDIVTSGELYEDAAFASVPAKLQRLNDIAFSGDGEPTTFTNFDQIIHQAAELKRSRQLDQVKLVLITNASMFHRPVVARGLAILDENQGEVWAKLDAGTAEYYHEIDRTKIPFARIIENITNAARIRPLVIQSLFMRVNGLPPSDAEITAYVRRLKEMTAAGGSIRLVQVYTVARPPAESFVSSLTTEEVDHIANRVECETGLPSERHYGN
ncbi:MAG: radical SAM protein [Planctomycetaceae bacterium]